MIPWSRKSRRLTASTRLDLPGVELIDAVQDPGGGKQ